MYSRLFLNITLSFHFFFCLHIFRMIFRKVYAEETKNFSLQIITQEGILRGTRLTKSATQIYFHLIFIKIFEPVVIE